MRWHLLLSGAACAAGFTWAFGCATGTTGEEPSGGSMDATPMECKMASDCPSGVCRATTTGAKPVCVSPCKQQSDCGATSFCEPTAAGSADGICVPRSAVHCLACAKDADCGAASAACFQAPGDTALACHVDCALSGSNACPDDYTCSDQMVNGKARKLCLPKANVHCIDAQGGFCDGQAMAQPCSRTSTDGTCTGERACLAESKRFDKCSATVPTCKTDCAAMNPTGCTVNFCAGAAKGPGNCGECGKACPGYMKPNDNVTCASNLMCSFSCKGESYDVDNNPATGCEVTDTTLENHDQSTALDIVPEGQSCFDNEPFSLTGEHHLISDKRAHASPEITGFEPDIGAAPDWFSMVLTGGLCEANCKVTLQVNGSTQPDCYHLRVELSSGYTNDCQTSATSGACTIKDFNTGLYATGDTAYLAVSKTCPSEQTEDVTYNLTGFF